MPIVDHGIPVVSSRQWVTGLSPDAAGTGWNYIMASWPGGPVPVEWVVLKELTTAPAESIYETTTHHYPNSLYALGTSHGQIRAPNGRIFWPLFANYMAYYDPATEQVHEFGAIVEDPPIATTVSTIPYASTFDVGGLLYMSTQESQFRPSCVFVTDPDTLEQTILGYVGSDSLSYTTYGYRLVVDTITDKKWAYVAYGENPWQLWALDITPGATFGTATKLDEVTATGNIQFSEIAGKGWTAIIDTNLGQPDNVRTQWWCLDGEIYAYTAGVDPPVAARNVTPASTPLVNPPEIDTSGGTGVVGWRESEDDPYTYVHYDVTYASPVAIESLVASNDGILGNAQNYNGFFQFFEPADNHSWFGSWAGGISQGPRLNVDGTVYFAGYPNGVLYRYDPDAAWLVNVNPVDLGNYGLNGTQFAGIKYADQLAWSAETGRLYCTGSRERNGVGMGIGYYDTNAESFAGTYGLAGMDLVLPTGLVVDDAADLVIVATRNISLSGDAPMFVFAPDLGSATMPTPLPGVANLGKIFPTKTTGVVCGIVQGSSNRLALYHFNALTGQLLAYVETRVVGTIGAMTAHPNSAVWVMAGNLLVHVDVDALTATVLKDLTSLAPIVVSAFAADEKTLFVAGGSPEGVDGAQLYSVTLDAPKRFRDGRKGYMP